MNNSYSQRKQLQTSLGEFIEEWQRVREKVHGCELFHITLATHQETSIQHARTLLRNWDARMNRAILGGRWSKREDKHCEWIAVLEGRKSDLHWHMVFCLSPALSKPLRKRVMTPSLTHRTLSYRVHGVAAHPGSTKHNHGMVADMWRKVTSGKGTADTVLINYMQGISDYLSKEQHDAFHYDSFITSLEFKR